MSKDEELQDAIIHFNRAYLLLAQRLICENPDNGARLFGLSDEMTSLIGKLTPEQINALSSADKLVCSPRTDDPSIFSGVMH
jgi:hypothetical protein